MTKPITFKGISILSIKKEKEFYGHRTEYVFLLENASNQVVNVVLSFSVVDKAGITQNKHSETIYNLSLNEKREIKTKFYGNLKKGEGENIILESMGIYMSYFIEQAKDALQINTVIGIAGESIEKEKKSYCFIATACYGDYDAPEVLILREYRDDVLLKTLLGRIFTKLYYAISPFFTKYISSSPFLKKIFIKSIN